MVHPALHDLVEELRGRFELVDGLPQVISQTGEEYEEFAGGAVPRDEGEPGIGVTSAEAAVRLLRDGIMRYAEGKSGALYWRIMPEIDCYVVYEDAWYVRYRSVTGWRRYTGRLWAALRGKPDPVLGEKKLWYTYARLLISDKPVNAGLVP
jgi:hypothetical protein